jgi:hypothetical protein
LRTPRATEGVPGGVAVREARSALDASCEASSPFIEPTTRAGADDDPAAPARPRPERRMRLAKTIHGNISPKLVVASGSGYIVAQNMMYRHSITVYDRSDRLVKTISDRVDLEALGGPATGRGV